ncbi:glycosyltransferase [Rheinheimera sp. A13L]|uniref:glycosyltransferase n=1 Tax=Rheinheimera sp. A13L TaxID=506534 RepID=UPI0002124F42|nr:glycosyltransferase [Rheinheimera sp. A13L]EGM75982.1 glycosyltransferase [Rheinheimera sp. A13L]
MNATEVQQSEHAVRIIHIIDSFNGGGAEAVVLRLHEAINNQPNAESYIVSLSRRSDYDISHLTNCYVLPFGTNKNLDSWYRVSKVRQELLNVIRQIEQGGAVTAIYSHLDVSHSVVAGLQCEIKRHYVVHASCKAELSNAKKRGFFGYQRLKRRKAVMHQQHLVTVSAGVGSELQGDIDWLQAASVTTIYNPFDTQAILNSAQATEPALPQSPYLLHIGRVSAQKRHDRLFDAYKRSGVDTKLVLLTKDSTKLRKLIKNYDLEHKVVVIGFTQNPFVWMRHAELLLLSSDYEGLPNVLNEALICGTPVLSTDCPHGPAEILQNFHEDWLVPMSDIDTFAKKIKLLLQTKPKVDVEQWPMYEKIQASYAANSYIQHALKHMAD